MSPVLTHQKEGAEHPPSNERKGGGKRKGKKKGQGALALPGRDGSQKEKEGHFENEGGTSVLPSVKKKNALKKGSL